MNVSAHAGHWYVELLFAAPALLIIGAIARESLRRRWHERPEQRKPGEREPR
jgi:hypothetical protein